LGTKRNVRGYTAAEEWVHAGSHGLGVALAACALVMLLLKADGTLQISAVAIYGGCMILMYLCSTLYHAAYNSAAQPFLKMLDHASIYFKIAGSYTPLALISLPTSTGLWVLAGAWAAALTGTVFKLTAFVKKSGRRLNYVSLAMYLAMGWAGLLMISPLSEALPDAAIYWLLAGGACFSIGAIFYAIKSVPYFHAIWHVFVLAGSACHFAAIYCYVI
jgi:hemolysin III